jgi:protocatechuate 3,4-dioxygenase beta subunit
MLHRDDENSRRQFLLRMTCFGSVLGSVSLAARQRLSTDEPFDSLPESVWRNARDNGLVMIHRPTPNRLSSQAQIARSEEPGERLAVAGRVFSPDGRTPAQGVTVYAYNTDAQGYYGENHKEYPPRLYGWMKTDGDGRFELRTIRPGWYPGMQVPAHVHFELWGSGYPLQWTEELKFEGDRHITPSMLAEDAQKAGFRTIQRVVRGDDGTLACNFSIKMQRESNFH